MNKELIYKYLQGFTFWLLFMSACGGHKLKDQADKPLKYSEVTTRVCSADTTQSYAVYLPTSYSKQMKWPVIYVFDPHGDGKLAVNHFKDAAERYGYIVFGSNNSRNGLATLDNTLKILLEDTRKEFSSDPNRQYAGGFSGGGRVATTLALNYGNVKGIITCSAGLSGLNPQMTPVKFDIYAIAGREDFNMNEVMSIQQQFSNSDWRTVTTAFDGGHAWPPVSCITHAVQWFELNAMRDGLIQKDEPMLEQALDSFNISSNQYMSSHQYLKAVDECKMGIAYLSGLISTKKLEKRLRYIQAQDEYLTELKNKEQLTLTEEQLKKGFIQSFETQDITWWKNELSTLTSRVNENTELGTHQMYSRIKGFLGIVCYSFTSKAIQENNMPLAAKLLDIYETLEPQNPDCFYYKALFLDKKTQYQEAAASLQKAVTLGFKEMSKAQTQLSPKTLKLFKSVTP